MKYVGVVLADRGSAIVHVEHDGDERLVSAIERLPFSLTTVAERVQELDHEIAEVRFVIDAEGLGGALWAVLGPPDDAERWRLYSGRGIERQSLVDTLLVAIERDHFHFAPNLPQQEAMTKALQSYRRQVREDGIVGSELVVALLLALIPPPPPAPEALFAWGSSPFERRDAANGARVAGHRLVRGDDGALYAVTEPRGDPPEAA